MWLRNQKEVDDLKGLIRGAFGVLRNPLSHRPTPISPTDAFAALCVAHLVHSVIDSIELSAQEPRVG
jgi:hypothetical protein